MQSGECPSLIPVKDYRVLFLEMVKRGSSDWESRVTFTSLNKDRHYDHDIHQLLLFPHQFLDLGSSLERRLHLLQRMLPTQEERPKDNDNGHSKTPSQPSLPTHSLSFQLLLILYS